MITLSVDIETHGVNPAKHAVIAVGVAAYNDKGELIDTFQQNINPSYSGCDKNTMQWWEQFPSAYRAVTTAPVPVNWVMANFMDYVVSHMVNDDVVFLGYNSHFDMAFLMHLVYTYCPIWTRPPMYCIELRDILSAKLNLPRKETAKREWPEEFTAGFKVDDSLEHTPLYDAMVQAHVYFYALTFNKHI